MENKDKELLNLLQTDFPICSEPFSKIGRRLGMSEQEVLKRIGMLKENGYIRRIGGIFNSGKLGYVSTLCAMKVPENRLAEVSAIINGYSSVTHNYIRQHSYNLWFTLIEPSPEVLRQTISDIKSRTGIDDLLNLPAVKIYKINANFDMKG